MLKTFIECVFSSGLILTPVHLQALFQAAVVHPAAHPLPSSGRELQVRVKLEAPVTVGQNICRRHIGGDFYSVPQPAHPHFLGEKTQNATLKHGLLPVVSWLGLTDLDNRRHWSVEMMRPKLDK